MLEVLFHFDATPRVRSWLAAHAGAGVRLAYCPEDDDRRFAELLPTAEVLWHVLRPVAAADIASAPRLRLIQKIGVGVNTIAVDAARERGVAVCNLPGTNSRAVAEMALLLMLATLRRLRALDAAIRQPGGWEPPAAVKDELGELGGRTVGLVGFGSVPRLLAPWLAAMGAKVLYAARSRATDAPYEWRPTPELLAAADIVSLHVPLTAATERMLDARTIGTMRPGAILINTARGGLVDEAALLAALESGHLRGAGLDVFAEEPVRPGAPLLAHPRVIATPHVAWLTGETFERALAAALENCRRLAAGEPLLNRVA